MSVATNRKGRRLIFGALAVLLLAEPAAAQSIPSMTQTTTPFVTPSGAWVTKVTLTPASAWPANAVISLDVAGAPSGGYGPSTITPKAGTTDPVSFYYSVGLPLPGVTFNATGIVAAVSDGTLTGLPSTIVAGKQLSGVTYSTPTSLYFVLYKIAGAVEEGSRVPGGNMPGNLNLLIPQTAGAYTVRGYTVTGPSTSDLSYESAQFTVTAPPGALPATPTQTADTGAGSGAVTMNWTATATSYRVLARSGVGFAYGSLADVTVTTNSRSFTGLPANSSPRAVIIPQNANGYGTPTSQFISFAGS